MVQKEAKPFKSNQVARNMARIMLIYWGYTLCHAEK